MKEIENLFDKRFVPALNVRSIAGQIDSPGKGEMEDNTKVRKQMEAKTHYVYLRLLPCGGSDEHKKFDPQLKSYFKTRRKRLRMQRRRQATNLFKSTKPSTQ